MIASFRCLETEKIYKQQRSRKYGNIQRAAFRKLILLEAITALSDLTGVGNSLEALRGNRHGQHAIRINEQFRLCFLWKNGNAYNVEIVDYH